MIREGDKSFLIEARSTPDRPTYEYFIVNGRNHYRADQKPDSKIPPNRLQLNRLSLVERAAVSRIRREITKKQK